MILHPAVSDVSIRRDRIRDAVLKGHLTPELSRYARPGWAYVLKETGVPALAYPSVGNYDSEDEGASTIYYVITTDDEDRDGDVVRPMGGQLHNYSKNPIVFFGHQEKPIPIGVCRSDDGRILVHPEENRTLGGIRFDREDPDADFIYGKCKRKILNATSIAFVPIEAWRRGDVRKARTHSEGQAEPGWYFNQWDMTELSVVGVPSNPKAVGLEKDLSGACRDVWDRERKEMSPQLRKAWQPYIARAKGCWGGWCPLPGDEKDIGGGVVLKAVKKSAGMDFAAQVRKVAEELAGSTDPAPMPGYGQIFRSPDNQLWYVGGDGDEDGFADLVQEKLGALSDDVTYESEGFPPEDEGWEQLYPEEKMYRRKAAVKKSSVEEAKRRLDDARARWQAENQQPKRTKVDKERMLVLSREVRLAEEAYQEAVASSRNKGVKTENAACFCGDCAEGKACPCGKSADARVKALHDSAAYKQGAQDARAGKPSTANPHPRGTFEHLEWYAGWEDVDDETHPVLQKSNYPFKVEQRGEEWFVLDDGKEVGGPFESAAEAHYHAAKLWHEQSEGADRAEKAKPPQKFQVGQKVNVGSGVEDAVITRVVGRVGGSWMYQVEYHVPGDPPDKRHTQPWMEGQITAKAGRRAVGKKVPTESKFSSLVHIQHKGAPEDREAFVKSRFDDLQLRRIVREEDDVERALERAEREVFTGSWSDSRMSGGGQFERVIAPLVRQAYSKHPEKSMYRRSKALTDEPAYREGRAAAKSGKSQQSNPHPRDTFERLQWDAGWEDADDGEELKAQPSADVDPDKACKILRDGEVDGKPLTDAQRGMFGAACARAEKSWGGLRETCKALVSKGIKAGELKVGDRIAYGDDPTVVMTVVRVDGSNSVEVEYQPGGPIHTVLLPSSRLIKKQATQADIDSPGVPGRNPNPEGAAGQEKASVGRKEDYKVVRGTDGGWYIVERVNKTDTELGPFNSEQEARRELDSQFSVYTPKKLRKKTALSQSDGRVGGYTVPPGSRKSEDGETDVVSLEPYKGGIAVYGWNPDGSRQALPWIIRPTKEEALEQLRKVTDGKFRVKKLNIKAVEQSGSRVGGYESPPIPIQSDDGDVLPNNDPQPEGWAACESCHGDGSCGACGGTGTFGGEGECPECGGSGECGACAGEGHVEKSMKRRRKQLEPAAEEVPAGPTAPQVLAALYSHAKAEAAYLDGLGEEHKGTLADYRRQQVDERMDMLKYQFSRAAGEGDDLEKMCKDFEDEHDKGMEATGPDSAVEPGEAGLVEQGQIPPEDKAFGDMPQGFFKPGDRVVVTQGPAADMEGTVVRSTAGGQVLVHDQNGDEEVFSPRELRHKSQKRRTMKQNTVPAEGAYTEDDHDAAAESDAPFNKAAPGTEEWVEEEATEPEHKEVVEDPISEEVAPPIEEKAGGKVCMCGAEVPEGASECPGCGAPVEKADISPSDDDEGGEALDAPEATDVEAPTEVTVPVQVGGPDEAVTDPAAEEILERYQTPKGWRTRKHWVSKALVPFLKHRTAANGQKYLVRAKADGSNEWFVYGANSKPLGTVTAATEEGALAAAKKRWPEAVEVAPLYGGKSSELALDDSEIKALTTKLAGAIDDLKALVRAKDLPRQYKAGLKHVADQIWYVGKALTDKGKEQKNGGKGSELSDAGKEQRNGGKGSELKDKGEQQGNTPTKSYLDQPADPALVRKYQETIAKLQRFGVLNGHA